MLTVPLHFSLIFKKSSAWLGSVASQESTLVASAILLVSDY